MHVLSTVRPVSSEEPPRAVPSHPDVSISISPSPTRTGTCPRRGPPLARRAASRRRHRHRPLPHPPPPSPLLLLSPRSQISCVGRRANNPSRDELHQPATAVAAGHLSGVGGYPSPARLPLPYPHPFPHDPTPLFHAGVLFRDSCPPWTPTAFDEYFRCTDPDRGDRISGQEAVTFFKGSGLPQSVLAQGPQVHQHDSKCGAGESCWQVQHQSTATT